MSDRRVSVSASGAMVVAFAAALWGTDALFRRGLALEAPATSVVLWEHALLAAVTLPVVIRHRAVLSRLDARGWIALILIGAGASATATVAFTQAFAMGDPTTPLLLQKVQPLVAVLLASLLLGERPQARLALFLIPGLAGAYLIAFPDPGQVSVAIATPAGLALIAATLWALGTVLGRQLSPIVPHTALAALRFLIGLPAAAVLALAVGDGLALPAGGQVPAIVGLSLVPGLLALVLYYRGLRSTPASVATIAELAFPLTAVVVNRFAFGTTLSTTQWIGLAVLSATVVVLSRTARRGSAAVGVPVEADRAPTPAAAQA